MTEDKNTELKLKHFPHVKPADDYKTLRKQFGSLLTFASAGQDMLSVYMQKDYDLSEKRLKALEMSLESERDMNNELTNEIEQLRTPDPRDKIMQDMAKELTIMANWDKGQLSEDEYERTGCACARRRSRKALTAYNEFMEQK